MKPYTTILLASMLALASCGGSEEPVEQQESNTEASAPAAVDVKAGADYFATTCSVCHGATGKGDGAGSAALVPKPRDLTDKEWQASVDDEYLRKIIQYGGAAVGKQPTMPANPVLGSQPDTMASLIAYIREMAE